MASATRIAIRNPAYPRLRFLTTKPIHTSPTSIPHIPSAHLSRRPIHSSLSRHLCTTPTLNTTNTPMSDLKTLPVLDDAALADGTMQQVEFDGQQILLSRINGQIHATSAFCTHYGAPLAKGVITQDGNVTCPWHGACFNVCTGDIEDSPGLDSLWKYTASVKEGKIYVSAAEKEVTAKVGRKILGRRAKDAAKAEKVVIVGGGAGAIHTVESLREHGFSGDIVVLSEVAYAPIDRTKLSKALISDATKLQWRTPECMRDEFGVDLRLSTTVSKVDAGANSVTTSTGDKISYDYLVLAPGSTPRKIPVRGKDLEGVITIRTPDDIALVNAAIADPKAADVIVIGTSFIGLEAAGALAKKGLKSLTVVGVDPVPFEHILGADIGEALVKNYESQGIVFHRGASVEGINAGEDGRVKSLSVKGLPDLPASIVIMGTGVAPTTSFLRDSGFALERDGGVLVDKHLRLQDSVTGGETHNVFAIGDIAYYPQHPTGSSRRVEHWNVAGNHGRTVGKTIANPAEPASYTESPVFWSSVGKGLRYVGNGGKAAQRYLDGKADELKFVLYQADEAGNVVTVASMGRDPVVAKASQLMLRGAMPTLDEIKAGKNILEIKI